jgi:sensor domain CHASE-containing protein
VENKLCLIYFINLKGDVVWGKGFDVEEESDIEFVEFPADRFPPEHPLLQHKPDKDGSYGQSNISGILNSKRGPLLLSSQPILTSDNEGPPRGTLIFGRLFNKSLLETLSQQTQVNFRLHPFHWMNRSRQK